MSAKNHKTKQVNNNKQKLSFYVQGITNQRQLTKEM